MSGAPATSANIAFRRFGIAPNVRPQGRFDLWARCAIRFLREIRDEATSRTGLPWFRRLRAWRRGFRSIYDAAYGLDQADPALYVPDFAYAYRCYSLNGFWNPIVGNKLVTSMVLAANGIPHPRVLGIIARGKLVEPGVTSRSADVDLLDRWTADGHPAVFRPHWSGGGQGVFFVRRTEAGWAVNGYEATDSDVHALLGSLDRYIATSFIHQAAYARTIYPHTTNSLRVLTLVDEEGPFVASVAHRFGTSRSLPIDNFRQGRGICAAVSTTTSTLGPGLSLGTRFERTWHSVHPDTASRIEGVHIEGLGPALTGILRAASCFPEAACVGWDVVLTNDGYSIIEANSPPGIVVSQLHQPLLTNPRVAKFFASHGFRVPVVR
jgi:hypothetical protein